MVCVFWRATDRAPSFENSRSSKSDLKRPRYEEENEMQIASLSLGRRRSRHSGARTATTTPSRGILSAAASEKATVQATTTAATTTTTTAATTTTATPASATTATAQRRAPRAARRSRPSPRRALATTTTPKEKGSSTAASATTPTPTPTSRKARSRTRRTRHARRSGKSPSGAHAPSVHVMRRMTHFFQIYQLLSLFPASRAPLRLSFFSNKNVSLFNFFRWRLKRCCAACWSGCWRAYLLCARRCRRRGEDLLDWLTAARGADDARRNSAKRAPATLNRETRIFRDFF